MNFQNGPLVSVVVVTYNHRQYIEKCLDSILNQKTNFEFEVVLGEDNSSDGTREICIEYARKYSNIRLRLQDRSNVIYIYNTATGRFNFLDCLSNTCGRYVAFCEGDDYWDSENKLQAQFDLLEGNSEFSGSYHNTYTVNSNGEETGLFRSDLPSQMVLDDLIQIISPFHTTSFFARKEYLINLPQFMKEVMSFDMALFFIVGSFGPVVKAESIFSSYRKHDAGITNKPGIKNSYHQLRIEMLSALSNYLGGASKEKFDEVIQKHQRAIQKAKEWEKPKSLTSRVLNRARRIFPKKK